MNPEDLCAPGDQPEKEREWERERQRERERERERARHRDQSSDRAEVFYSTLCRYLYCLAVAAAAKSLQPCLTLCDPIDGSPPGSPIPGILLARTLEWVAISFSNI